MRRSGEEKDEAENEEKVENEEEGEVNTCNVKLIHNCSALDDY